MLDIYVISLKKDTLKRKVLKNNFPENYERFIYVDAIDGHEQSIANYYENLCLVSRYKIFLSPTEWGCSLSHLETLKAFINSDSKYALILEDDIVGNDFHIQTIEMAIENLPQNFFLICGGQDGLITSKYLYGKEIVDNIFILANFSRSYLFRTCCYVVTKDIAEHIVNYHSNGVKIIDKWEETFYKKNIPFHYIDCLHHPVDLFQSNIESERLLKRNPEYNYFYRMFRFLYRSIMVLVLIILGYKKL